MVNIKKGKLQTKERDNEDGPSLNELKPYCCYACKQSFQKSAIINHKCIGTNNESGMAVKTPDESSIKTNAGAKFMCESASEHLQNKEDEKAGIVYTRGGIGHSRESFSLLVQRNLEYFSRMVDVEDRIKKIRKESGPGIQKVRENVATNNPEATSDFLNRDDLVYKASQDLTKEDLRGMYSLALKREQGKDRIIADLKKENEDLFESNVKLIYLHEKTIEILEKEHLNIPVIVNMITSSYKNEFKKLKPIEKIRGDKNRLKFLIIELDECRKAVVKLSEHSFKKKKELRIVESGCSLIKGSDESLVLLKGQVRRIRAQLLSSSSMTTQKIARIRELKIEISKIHLKGSHDEN